MSVLPTSALSTADAARVETVLRQLAPKWTTHLVHTIAKYGPAMRVRDVAHYHPAVSQPYISKRLATMAGARLMDRDATFDRSAPYRLSARARTLGPLYRAVAQWSSEHLDRAPQGRSDRIEDALHRLQLVDTTEVVRLLSEHGSMRVTHLGERVGVSEQLISSRLNRMQADGLVTRTGSRHGDPYALTDAGRALAPVYAAVQQWDMRHSAASPTLVPAAIRTLATGAGPMRTAAALRRSPAPTGLFSDAPAAQPRVPAAVTAASYPSHGR
ncbi:winged helix-turn-helix transcriptional regulator [Kitasatospora sp. NPDC092039]|uniref:winged helix-turn-helix transcriptional regulator n=1 Tax=Kitasatospora sp. NPDC092039 TaxID=3364086 RepID=UPI0037F2F381